MKRGGPLKRTASLKRSGTLSGGAPLKRTEINRRSNERQEFMENIRIPMIKRLIAEGRKCEIGPILAHYEIPGAENCTGQIQGLHERRKRSSGGSLSNPDNLVPACNICNGIVEDEGRIIREFTGDALVVREGDPEWVQLGARNDREP